MPSAEWIFIASSARISSRVVIPPAAVISCVVRRAQAAKPIEIRALHHAFFVDIGAEEAAAVRLELADDVFGGVVRRFAPALHDDAAVLGIERKQDLFGCNAGVQIFEEIDSSGPAGRMPPFRR